MDTEVTRLFQQMRVICLAQENTYEKLSHGFPAFFILKGGQFATLWDNHHGDGNIAVLVAQPPGIQELFVSEDEAIYYRPPYFGPSGWLGIRLDKVQDWDLVESLVEQGYEFVASKRKRK